MKRKPNNGAGPEPREAAGAADPGGAGERNNGGTSGQSVPKSKFRQKSNQEKAAASKLRMEKRGEKLDRAKEKLAKQKPPKKPGPVRRVGRVASGSAHSFVHGGHRRGPPLRACGRVCPAAWLPVCETENPGTSGEGGSEGGVPVYQGYGGLSLSYRRPGAPGALQKRFVPVLAEAAAPQEVSEAGKRGGQIRGPGRRENGCYHRKVGGPGGGFCETPNAIPWAVCWLWPASCLCW